MVPSGRGNSVFSTSAKNENHKYKELMGNKQVFDFTIVDPGVPFTGLTRKVGKGEGGKRVSKLLQSAPKPSVEDKLRQLKIETEKLNKKKAAAIKANGTSALGPNGLPVHQNFEQDVQKNYVEHIVKLLQNVNSKVDEKSILADMIYDIKAANENMENGTTSTRPNHHSNNAVKA